MTTELEEIFESTEKTAKKGGTGKRTGWRGALAITLPKVFPNVMQYQLKGAKVESDYQEIQVQKVDRLTKKRVETKLLTIGPDGHPMVNLIHQYRDVDAEAYASGQIVEIPKEQVMMLQDGEEVTKFDRTQLIEVSEENGGQIPRARISEYQISSLYMLAPDTNKDLKERKENPNRVLDLARKLLELDIALVAFFSFGRGFKFSTALIYPYERSDGKLWLVMALADGRMVFDEAWQLTAATVTNAPAPQVPIAKKPKVRLAV